MEGVDRLRFIKADQYRTLLKQAVKIYENNEVRRKDFALKYRTSLSEAGLDYRITDSWVYQVMNNDIHKPRKIPELTWCLIQCLRQDGLYSESIFQYTSEEMISQSSQTALKMKDLNDSLTIEASKFYSAIKAPPTTDQVEARISKFKHTRWWFYFCDQNTTPERLFYRSLLVIRDEIPNSGGNLSVVLHSVGKDFSNFMGWIERSYSTQNVLYLTLFKKDDDTGVIGKFRHLMIRIDSVGKKKGAGLYTGQYLRADEHHAINSRSVIIQELSDKSLGQVPEHAPLDTPEVYDLVDTPEIVDYFKLFPSNLDVHARVLSLTDLKKVVVLEKERVAQEQGPDSWDLYIAAPIVGLEEEEKNRVYQEIEELCKDSQMAQLGFHRIYPEIQDKPRLIDPSVELRQELEAIRMSRVCLFIFPQKKPILSSTTTLVGAAIYAEKPTFILYEDRSLLNRLIQGAKGENNVIMPSMLNKVGIKDFPEWIRSNSYEDKIRIE